MLFKMNSIMLYEWNTIVLILLFGYIACTTDASNMCFENTYSNDSECTETNINGTRDLHILHITSNDLADNVLPDSESSIDYAVSLVNARDDILPGYRVVLHTKMVEHLVVGPAVKAFIDGVTQEPVKIAIFGPAYSAQAKVVAETATFYNLVELAYSATSPALSDKTMYPYFARTIESTALSNLAIIKIIKYFRWAKVATVTFDNGGFMEAEDDMINILGENNIAVATSASYKRNPNTAVSQIKKSNARILLSYTMFYDFFETRLLCQVYRQKLYDQRFQWIHFGLYWMLLTELAAEDHKDGCSREQLVISSEGWLVIHAKTISPHQYESIPGGSGRTAQKVEEDYLKFVNDAGDYYTANRNNAIGRIGDHQFDAAWTLFRALNDSIGDLARQGLSLHEFTYENELHAKTIFSNVIKQEYLAQASRLAFASTGDKWAELNIFQMKSGEPVLVGEYNPFTDTLRWLVEENSLFKGGRPPFDSDVVRLLQKNVSSTATTLAYVFAVLGILYALVCCVFIFKYRHTKLVRMSSPRINYLMALGCVLTYTAVIIWGIETLNETTQQVLCNVKVWLLVCGFTCSFGSMFSKTFRVHRIMTTTTAQKKAIKDAHLLLLVVCFLAIDLVILSIWQITDPLQWRKTLFAVETDDNMDGILYQPFVYTCTSNYNLMWTGAIYVIKGLLLIFGIFFAWETRKVKIEALNDSKHIGISVYNIMIASLIAVPLVNILPEEQYNTVYAITVVSMLACATLTISLVFGTKIYEIILHGSKVDDLAQTPFQASLKASKFTPQTA